MRLKPGQRFADRFTVEAHVSNGGFGAVYRCQDDETHEQVALKILHPSVWTEPKVVVRFEREAALLATLDHPNVVRVRACGVDDATRAPWMALELLSGVELEAHLVGGQALAPSVVCTLMEQLGEGMRAAQSLGVIHADLKPENVMVIGALTAPTLKVIDFGVAFWIRDGKTHASVTTTLCSPLWAAPEQFVEGAKVRAATDVWSVGLLAFRMLTGKMYWRHAQEGHEKVIPTVREALMDPIVPASERAQQLGVAHLIPPEFDTWFRHCVARDHEERFQRVDAAVRALLSTLSPRGLSLPSGASDDDTTTWIMRPSRAPSLPSAEHASPEVLALADARDWSRLRAAIDLAMRDGGDHPSLWSLRAESELRLGRFDEALVSAHEAVRRAPGGSAHLIGRAAVFEALGDARAAEADRAVASVLDRIRPPA